MKNVLLTGLEFHNYVAAIRQKLTDLGYKVYNHLDRYSIIDAIFPSLFPTLSKKELLEYQKDLIKRVSNVRFDFVIVVVGRFLSPYYLRKLKEMNPEARFILVLWDDISRVQNFEDVYPFYDDIFSFDPSDTSKYGFHFLPLFYTKRRNNSTEMNNQFAYDIYSAMACHSDREKIAKQIIQKYDNYKIHVDMLLSLKDIISRKIKNETYNENITYLSRFNMIDEEKLFDNMLKSKAILDVQYVSQIGLTIRTFDTMSVGRKLITTNPSIRYYNFYHENNICVIDRENPIIPDEFLECPYEKIDDDIINCYSVDRYVSVLLGKVSENYLVKNNPYNI